MAREIYAKDVKFTAYSYTHRESHDGIAMMDVDKVCCCIACNEPLFLLKQHVINNLERTIVKVIQ